MRDFKLLFLVLFSLLFISCSDENRPIEGMKKVHWDRDMCERCKMIVSERKFAVQIVDEHHKSHMFDDIGCAILWFEEENLTWLDKAKIWINDAHTGDWIDARKSIFAVGNLTPMGYGVSAYTKETHPKGATALDFEDAKKIIYDINEEHKRRRALREQERETNDR